MENPMLKLLRSRYLLAFTCVFALLPAGRAADLTKALPADTAIYIGWSQLADPNSPEYRNFEKTADRLRAAVAKQADEKAARLVDLLFQYLPALQTGSFGIGVFDVTLAGDTPDIQLALVADAGKLTASL